MLKLGRDRPNATVLWPKQAKISQRILGKISSPNIRGEFVYSANTLGELVCLEGATGKSLWTTDTVTGLAAGSCIHIVSDPDGDWLFTDQGELIRVKLTPTGYREKSRVPLIEPAQDYLGRKVIWTSPAFVDGLIFVRNDRELVCFSWVD